MKRAHILLGLFFFLITSSPVVFADENNSSTTSIIDAFSGVAVSDVGSIPFSIYSIEIARDNTSIETFFFELGDEVWKIPMNGAYSYYPLEKDVEPVVNEIWSSLLRNDSNPWYELNVWYNRDGSINFDKSVLALASSEYSEGRSVEIQKRIASDDGTFTFESATVKKMNVCFDYRTTPHTQTGLCNYYTLEEISPRTTVSEKVSEKVANWSMKVNEVEEQVIETELSSENQNILSFAANHFFDNFSSGFPTGNWTTGDLDTTSPNNTDYWGASNYRFYSGPYSIWSAQFDTQTSGVSNSSIHNYDDRMDAYAQIPFNMVGQQTANIEYAFWLDAEDAPSLPTVYDGLKLEYRATGGTWQTIKNYDIAYDGGDSDPLSRQWDVDSFTIPASFNVDNITFRFTFYSDSSIHNREGAYLDDIYIDGLLPNGVACSSASDCFSNICSGAHTDVIVHCNIDRAATAYGDKKDYSNACGGGGVLSNTTFDFYSGTCPTNKVCDIDLGYTASSFSTSTICKLDLEKSCNSNSECWNDNGGVECKGNAGNKICTYGTNGSYCSQGAQCNSGICLNNQCSAGVQNGDVCTRDAECQSKYCIADTPTQSHCQDSSLYSPFTAVSDTWDAAASNNHSSATDQVAFTGTTVRPVTFDLRESTDALCYDFDGDNVYDACYYDSNGCNNGQCGFNSCNYSIPNSVAANKKFSCDIDSFLGCQIGVDTSDQICSSGTCSVSTSSIKTKDPKVTAFYDCDNSDSLQSEHLLQDGPSDNYWVVNPKYYYCSSQTSPGSQYYTLGDYGPTFSDAKIIQGSLSCGSGTSCSIFADEQYVSAAAGTIPSACKTNAGGNCSQNSDCLYNKCQNSTCSNGFIYESFILDELGNPLSNQTVKQYTCSNSLVQSVQTDLDGKFVFASGTGSYIMKLVVPWGEIEFNFSGDSCHNFGQGFITDDIWQFETHTTVHGQIINPQGDPEVGQPWELSSCQDVALTSTTTNSSGDFQLYANSGKQKIKVELNGTKFALQDQTGSACVLNYGDTDLGQMEITANCSLYNDTCVDEDIRQFNCTFDPQSGCSCSFQYCAAGCTEGAPQCNVMGTGTIHVIVKDGDKPVKNAPVWVNGATAGQTSGKGKLDINEEHGSYTIKAACPDNSQLTTKPTFLSGNHQYVTFNLDCPDPPKGKLVVSAWTVDVYPAANVQVLVDNEIVGLTNGFGVIQIDEVEYGSHPVIIRYLLEYNGNNFTYQQTKLADVNQSSNNLDFTIYPAGQVGFGVTEINPADGGITVTLIAIGAFAWGALDTYSTALDIADFCSCVLGQDAPQNEFQACIDNMILCDENLQGSTCKTVSKNYGTVNECADEAIFLGADAGLIGVPLGVAKKTLAKLPDVANDIKVVDSIINFGGKITKKGKTFLEYVGSTGKKLRAEIADILNKFMKIGPNVGIPLSKLTNEGFIGAEAYLAKLDSISSVSDSSNIAKKLVDKFGEEGMANTFEGYGKALSIPGYDPQKIRWGNELADRTKTFNPQNFDSVGNAKGIINEIRVANAKGYIDDLEVAAYKVNYGAFQAEYDGIANSIAREVKSPFSLVDSAKKLHKTSNPSLEQVVGIIDDQVNRMNAGQWLLPQGANFTQIHFYIAKEQGEVVPAIVTQALEEARLSGKIAFWEVVNI